MGIEREHMGIKHTHMGIVSVEAPLVFSNYARGPERSAGGGGAGGEGGGHGAVFLETRMTSLALPPHMPALPNPPPPLFPHHVAPLPENYTEQLLRGGRARERETEREWRERERLARETERERVTAFRMGVGNNGGAGSMFAGERGQKRWSTQPIRAAGRDIRDQQPRTQVLRTNQWPHTPHTAAYEWPQPAYQDVLEPGRAPEGDEQLARLSRGLGEAREWPRFINDNDDVLEVALASPEALSASGPVSALLASVHVELVLDKGEEHQDISGASWWNGSGGGGGGGGVCARRFFE